MERPTSHIVGRRCGGTTFPSSLPRRAAPVPNRRDSRTFENCSPTVARRGIRFGQIGSLNHPIAGKQVVASVGDLSGPEPVAGLGPLARNRYPYPPTRGVAHSSVQAGLGVPYP